MDARARVAESRWRLSLPEWGLVACFFYTLLSYPFYLKYVAYSAYQTGFVAFLLAVIVFFVVEPRVLPVGRTALLQPPIALGVALYGVYVLAVGVASLLNAGEGYLIAELGRLLVKAVLGVAFVACVSERVHGWMLDRYTDVMLAAAIAGTILVVGVALGWFSPIGKGRERRCAGSGEWYVELTLTPEPDRVHRCSPEGAGCLCRHLTRTSPLVGRGVLGQAAGFPPLWVSPVARAVAP